MSRVILSNEANLRIVYFKGTIGRAEKPQNQHIDYSIAHSINNISCTSAPLIGNLPCKIYDHRVKGAVKLFMQGVRGLPMQYKQCMGAGQTFQAVSTAMMLKSNLTYY